MQRSIIPKYVSKAMIKTTEAKFIYSHLIYPPPQNASIFAVFYAHTSYIFIK